VNGPIVIHKDKRSKRDYQKVQKLNSDEDESSYDQYDENKSSEFKLDYVEK
jgi:hypothetical protein